MTISEFNLIQSLVIQYIEAGSDLEPAFETVKDMVFPRRNKPITE